MDKLYKAAEHYRDNLLNRKFRLTAVSKGKTIQFDIVFSAANFKHLTGLNKLTDLPIINGSSSAVNFMQILNKELTYDVVSRSKYFSEAKLRIEYFSDLSKALNSDELMLKSEHGNFNTIVADFMLSNKDTCYGYALLFTKKDDRKGYTVPVTFIINADNSYFRTNAQRWKVLSVIEIKKQ